jgi:hypothetical protein
VCTAMHGAASQHTCHAVRALCVGVGTASASVLAAVFPLTKRSSPVSSHDISTGEHTRLYISWCLSSVKKDSARVRLHATCITDERPTKSRRRGNPERVKCEKVRHRQTCVEKKKRHCQTGCIVCAQNKKRWV